MITLYFLLTVLAIALVWLASLPGKYTVSQTKTIEAPVDQVFDTVRNLSTWKNWNPWLIHEPDAKLVISDKPAEKEGYYTWEGKAIGAGKMTNITVEKNLSVIQKLEFLKPFKSQADVEWILRSTDEGTQVTWTMKSAMPFIMRPMIPMIKKMIASDYKIGLMMLDQHINPKADVFQLDFNGKQLCEKISGISKDWQGSFNDIATAMSNGFEELMEEVSKNKLEVTSPPLSMYEKVNLKKMTTKCSMIIPTDLTAVPGHLSSTEIPSGSYYKVTYKGSYEHLSEAWYAAYSHLRMHKIKNDKKRSSYEVYLTDPQSTTANETITELYLPIK